MGRGQDMPARVPARHAESVAESVRHCPTDEQIGGAADAAAETLLLL